MLVLMNAFTTASAAASPTLPPATFEENVYTNEHFRMEIQPDKSVIWGLKSDSVKARAERWRVEGLLGDEWTALTEAANPRLWYWNQDDYQEVLATRPLEEGLQLNITYAGAKLDSPSSGPKITADLLSLNATGWFRVVWEIEAAVADYVLLQHWQADGVMPILGPNPVAEPLIVKNSLVNSVVFMDGKYETNFGLNWEDARDLFDYVSIQRIKDRLNTRVYFRQVWLEPGERLLIDPIVEGGGGGGGSTTKVKGYVKISDTNKGIYGAKVKVGSYVTYTSSNGFYSITLSSGGTYSTEVRAFGYSPFPLTGSVSVSTGSTTTKDYSLDIWNTYDNEVWYNLPNNQVITNTVLYSENTDSNSLTVINDDGESDAPGWTPSGSAQMIRMKGNDYSSSDGGYAYTYFKLKDVNIPLSSPMYLAFNVYVVTTPKQNGKASVDAHFTDGSVLRDIVDDRGYKIKDGYKRDIHPAGENFVAGEWTRVVADLTEVRYKTIDYLMVAYDNGQTGGSGEFKAYFDDIRLEVGTYQVNVINGGFENDLYGWTVGGDYEPEITTWMSVDGEKAVLLQTPSAVPADIWISQTFRIPKDTRMLSTYLDFWYYLITDDSSGDWVKVTLEDRTTDEEVVIWQKLTSTTWASTTVNLDARKGHILTLTFQVHLDSDSYLTYAYFDEVRVRPEGVQVDEVSGQQTKVQLHGAYFLPGEGVTRILALSFSGYNNDDSLEGGITISVDLFKYEHEIASLAPDELWFTISTVAWTEGAVWWGPRYFIREVTLTVSISTEVGDAGSVNFWKTFGFELLPSTGHDSLDPSIIVLGGLAILLAATPATGAYVLGQTIALTVIGGGYSVWTSLTQPSPPSATWANNPSDSDSYDVYEGGGDAYTYAFLSNDGGIYRFDISAQAEVYGWTWGSAIPVKIGNLSGTYTLIIDTTYGS